MGLRYEIRLSGTGGQGLVLAAIILAEAAAHSGKGQRVAQTVHYGPQVRGGLSEAEVVISDEEIDYPLPIRLDLLVPFSQEAADHGADQMKPGGIIIRDPELVPSQPEGWVADIPLTRLALETTGRSQMANIAALGAVSALCPLVTSKAMTAALKGRTAEDLVPAFLKAAEAGRKAAGKVREKIHFEEAPSVGD